MFIIKVTDSRLLDEDNSNDDVVRECMEICTLPGVATECEEGQSGIGATGPALILKLASVAFFSIPVTYIAIKKAVKGWNEIYKDMSRIFRRFRRRDIYVLDCSKEIALLYALKRIEKKYQLERSDIDDLVLHAVIEINGIQASSTDEASMIAAEISQYIIVLRENKRWLYNIMIDSRLHVSAISRAPLDPRILFYKQ